MSRSEFKLAAPGIRIAPSLLSADFSALAPALKLVEDAGCEVIHLDVMDGHFVPNISFGIPVIKSIRACSKMFFDAHLMIQEPARYAEAFVGAGCELITFHIEVTDDPAAVVSHIRSLGANVGVSLNPTTPASAIDSIIEQVDLVLVMSVWPGFGGQKFIADVLPKVEALRAKLEDTQRLQIDGGIDPTTIASAASAGADTFVAGTAVYRRPDPVAAMNHLAELAKAARPN